MSPAKLPMSQDEPRPSGQMLLYRDGALNLQVRLDGQTVWLSQRQLADLYQTTVSNISQHLAAIYEEGELLPEATIKRYLIVQIEGGRRVRRLIDHYSLEVILALGYRVRSLRGTQFRQWVTAQLRELLVKGFVLDDDRIKAGRTIGRDYFDELLERIRDIRSSERLFYQKITDIYATSIDYDPDAEISKAFFATVQNKLHWAIHARTAAEVIRERADATKPHMGLTTWKNAPHGPIRKTDVGIAKNYLTVEEITELNRIVSMYLDYAEDQARRRNPMHMADWVARLDAFLRFHERSILTHAGSVSHELAQQYAHQQFEEYERQRLSEDATKSLSDFDKLVNEAKHLGASLPVPEAFKKPARKPSVRRRRHRGPHEGGHA